MFMSSQQPHRQRGFTLIELVMFIVIVGIGVAGILSVFTTSVKSSADPMVRKQALSIAESLLEEILLKEFIDPNGSGNGVGATCSLGAGTNRSLWDDVCDYNGYTSTGIKDVQGNSIASLSGYNVSAVAVTTVTQSAITYKRVAVTITDTQNNTISLAGYRGNY